MIRHQFYIGPSYDILFEEYARQGRIDEQAPVKTSGGILIAAPPERVWDLLIDLARWPVINPAFSDVRLQSLPAERTTFSFKLNNFPIKAELAAVDPCRLLTWVGTSLWFRAIDVLRLEPVPSGSRLYMAESFSGFLAPLFVSSEQLRRQHDQTLNAFKRAAENQH